MTAQHTATRTLLTSCLMVLAALAVAGCGCDADGRERDRADHGKKHHGKKHAGKITRHLMRQADANADGAIDWAEYSARRQQLFAALDADGSGRLSKDEFARRREVKRRHRMMRMLDADADGQISSEEFAAGGQISSEEFAAGGQISSEEFAAGGKHGMKRGSRMKMRHRGMRMLLGPGPGSEEQREQHKAELFAALDSNGDSALDPAELAQSGQVRQSLRFARLDSDGSGSVGSDEYLAPARAHFAGLDADSSGSLSAEELTSHIQAAVKAMRRHFPMRGRGKAGHRH